MVCCLKLVQQIGFQVLCFPEEGRLPCVISMRVLELEGRFSDQEEMVLGVFCTRGSKM